MPDKSDKKSKDKEAHHDPKSYDVDEGWAFNKQDSFAKKIGETRSDMKKFAASKNRVTAERERKPLTEEEMADFEKASMYCPLTGILNAKSFFKKLDYELRRAKRYKRPLSLMMLQVDNMDHYKRQYGAMVEDEVVKSVSKLLQTCIRDVDVPGRGEGICLGVIFPETYSSRAMVVAERVKEKLRTESVSSDLRHLKVTGSLGVVSFPTHARDEHELMRKVMEFVEHAKSEGGDRVHNG